MFPDTNEIFSPDLPGQMSVHLGCKVNLGAVYILHLLIKPVNRMSVPYTLPVQTLVFSWQLGHSKPHYGTGGVFFQAASYEPWCKTKGLSSGDSLGLACIPARAQAALWGASERMASGLISAVNYFKKHCGYLPSWKLIEPTNSLCWITVRKIRLFSFKTVLTSSSVKTAPVASYPGRGKCGGRAEEGIGKFRFNFFFFVIDYFNFSLKQSNEDICQKHCHIVAHFYYFSTGS